MAPRLLHRQRLSRSPPSWPRPQLSSGFTEAGRVQLGPNCRDAATKRTNAQLFPIAGAPVYNLMMQILKYSLKLNSIPSTTESRCRSYRSETSVKPSSHSK